VLPTISATAYLTPLREGGSLPGLMEADDLGTYVVKFTGAGQGPKTLVAEIVVGELGRLLGVLVPRLALIEVDAEIGHREPDEEVQQLVVTSAVSIWLSTSCPAPLATTGPLPCRARRPLECSGWTPTWPTWTAAPATPIC
jgi:hypothetical protein